MAETIADLVVRISADVEVLKRDMADANRVVRRGAEDISAASAFASSALSTLVGYFSIDLAFTTFRKAVSELDNIGDQAENAGTTVEKFTQLMADVAPSGVGVGELSGMLQQLNRSLLQAEQHTSRAAQAFKAMGISVHDSNGNLRDQTDIFREVAQKMGQYEDGANKSALMTATLGRSGARAVTVMNDLAQSTGETNLYTADMIKNADALNKQLNLMEYYIGQARNALLSKLIPGLLTTIEHFRRAAKEGQSFWQSFLSAPLPGANLVDIRRFTSDQLAEEEKRLETLQKSQADAQAKLDTSNRFARPLNQRTLDAVDARIADTQKKINALQAQLRVSGQVISNEAVRHAEGLGDTYDARDRQVQAANAPKDPAPKIPGADREREAQRAARERMQESLQILDEGKRRVLDVERKSLEDVERMQRLGVVNEQFAIEERLKIRVRALNEQERILASEVLLRQAADTKLADPSALAAVERRRAQIAEQITEAERKAVNERIDLWSREASAARQAADAVNRARRQAIGQQAEANAAAEDEIEALIRATVAGREYAEVLAEIRVQRLEAIIANNPDTDPLINQELEQARRQLALLSRRNAVESTRDRQQQERQSNADLYQQQVKRAEEADKARAMVIEQSLTDALLRGFENGANFAENFKNTLKNMFATLVLRPIIEPIMKPVADFAGKIVSAFLGDLAGLGSAAPIVSGVAAPDDYRWTGLTERAAGGPIEENRTYLVGERGPEILQLGTDGGQVFSAAQTRAATKGLQQQQSVTIHNNIVVDSRSDRASIEQAMDATLRATQASIIDASRRGKAVY
jgi:hypothetical protein